MTQYISKDALAAEINSMLKSVEHTSHCDEASFNSGRWKALTTLKKFLDTLEVKDPYEQRIQFASVKDGIEYYAGIYSYNIESELFNQLTKEQQALWQKEIEQACISGGEAGVELARDIRYKENLEVKEVDLGLNSFDATVCKIGSTYLKEMDKDAIIKVLEPYKDGDKVKVIIKAQKGE